MFLAAAWNTVRWIVQHDQDAQDLVQEACKLMISTPTSGLNAAQLTDGRDGFQEGTPKSSGRKRWTQPAKDSKVMR